MDFSVPTWNLQASNRDCANFFISRLMAGCNEIQIYID